MNDDHARARQFIMEFFNDEELNNFCFDYFPLVYNEFTTGMSKGQKVRLLVDSSRRGARLPDLLAALERERPDAYESHFERTLPAAPPPAEPKERNPRQLFISHAREDDDFARRLARDLESQGWAIWMAPDSIRPGEKWVEAINRGMAESGVFALVLTEAAVNSHWVESETNTAIAMEHEGELDFLPLEVEEVTAPPLWRGYQWISFRDDYKGGLEKLLGKLQPAEMERLSRLYDQLRASVGSADWQEAQRLGQEILELYPDYRNTAELIALAEQIEKTQEALDRDAKPHEQLLAEDQGKHRRERRRNRWPLPATLKKVPLWVWAIGILLPLTLVILWLAFGWGNGSQEEIATLIANEIALAETATAERSLFAETVSAAVDSTLVVQAQTYEAERILESRSLTEEALVLEEIGGGPAEESACEIGDIVCAVNTSPENVSIRTGPGTQWPSYDVELLPDNTVPVICRLQDGWLNVIWSIVLGRDGWVPGESMTIEGRSPEICENIPPTPTPTATPTPNPNLPEPGAPWKRPIDGMEMVYVPPPATPFKLDSGVNAPTVGYWIDKYEVSNDQYQKCVDAGACKTSGFAQDASFNGPDYPVVGVTSEDAGVYIDWLNDDLQSEEGWEYALPTEEEWEYAAVGNTGYVYPWGNILDGGRANYCDNNCPSTLKDVTEDDGHIYTAPVDSYANVDNWVGALNMAGNVGEWTASYYRCGSQMNSRARLYKGGAWNSTERYLRAADRGLCDIEGANSNSVGFRVLLRPPPCQ